ncbi:MAG: PP2C family protein-serine/threonine phosphatase [Desulfobacula sp.]|nr:PP2C family protein-serine/threonine phosphatase [Desulfobacula sp.]
MNYRHKNKVLSWLEVEKKITSSYRGTQVFANAVGIVVCYSYFAFFFEKQTPHLSWADYPQVPVLLSVLLVILGRFLSKKWLKEVYNFVENKIHHISIPELLEQKAKQKILNLPIASAIISLINWGIAALVIPFFFLIHPFGFQISLAEIYIFLWVATGIIISGMVTCVMVFFVTELICRQVWEKFFPAGELIHIKGVFRVKLWPRILIIFLMTSIFPLMDMAFVSYQKAEMMLTADPAEVLRSLMFLIIFLMGVECTLVIVLSMFMSRSIVAPILDLKAAMLKVEKADFDARAKVIDNNELGELSQHFNQMTIGLKERYEIMQSLAIAKEVQQNLLPHEVPAIDGLDIAGKSVYCDQTGGDYIDFIDTQIEGNQTQIFAIGDVSGHGIPSALLMSSARAFLRQRLALSGTLDQIITDVNVQFCNDVQATGRFMTLFVCALDLEKYTLKWIRAGHDPALLYDPTTDKFAELEQGGGIPLGIDETYIYQESTIPKNTFRSGQILFIGTDGIWESRNENKEMFGKERVKKVIRDNKDANAQKIMDNLFDDLDTFMGSCSYFDDVTLIVVKIE